MKEKIIAILHSSGEEKRELLVQFIKFGLVGVSNTLVSLAVYYIVLYLDPSKYILGSVLGTILSIANAFVWNDIFVFKGNAKDLKSVFSRLARTYISYGGTSLLSSLLLWIEVALLNVDKRVAPIINLVLTIPLNFLLNKFWTFRKKSEKEQQ